MKFSTALQAALLSSALIMASTPALSEQVQSLRGDVDIDAGSTSVELKRVQEDRPPIQRDYVQQPPLIPHDTEGYTISLQFNKCLTCHSWANYREAGATKISQTHFADRTGDVHANIAARRYFCTQCHVPQVDAPPLVENSFKPLEAIKK
jgi:cytochrome c-type protein NapB